MRIIFYPLIFILTAAISYFHKTTFIGKLITFITLSSGLISVYEAFHRKDPLSFKNLKEIKESLAIIGHRFLKIFIPAFLILMIFTTIFIEVKPAVLSAEKSLFHISIIVFMLILLIFSIHSIITLDFRKKQLDYYEKQLWKINNKPGDPRHEHYEKINKILNSAFALISRKSYFARNRSIWVLIPHFDPDTKERYFTPTHFVSQDFNEDTYDKLLNNKVPFLDTEKWIEACDNFHNHCKESKGEKLRSEYLKFIKEKNKFSSVAGYVYLRNLSNPETAKHFGENCIVYNDRYKKLFTDKEELKKVNWKSMIVWYMSYNRKKIGICFFFDTERFGLRPGDKLIMKIMANSLAPVLYYGIEKGYYGGSAAGMLEKAMDIDQKDEIKKALGTRYKSKEWKGEIKEILLAMRKFKSVERGY